jgi:hypothetical protein
LRLLRGLIKAVRVLDRGLANGEATTTCAAIRNVSQQTARQRQQTTNATGADMSVAESQGGSALLPRSMCIVLAHVVASISGAPTDVAFRSMQTFYYRSNFTIDVCCLRVVRATSIVVDR